jgi:hypothetical protein
VIRENLKNVILKLRLSRDLKKRNEEMKHRFIIVALIVGMAISTASAVFAAEPKPATVDNYIGLVINNTQYFPELSNSPVLVNGTSMVPMRYISSIMGWGIDWNADERKVTVSRGNSAYIMSSGLVENGDLVVVMQIGNKSATVIVTGTQSVKTVQISEPPVIIQGSTYVPLRFLSEAFGCDVNWIKDSRTGQHYVSINNSKRVVDNPYPLMEYKTYKELLENRENEAKAETQAAAEKTAKTEAIHKHYDDQVAAIISKYPGIRKYDQGLIASYRTDSVRDSSLEPNQVRDHQGFVSYVTSDTKNTGYFYIAGAGKNKDGIQSLNYQVKEGIYPANFETDLTVWEYDWSLGWNPGTPTIGSADIPVEGILTDRASKFSDTVGYIDSAKYMNNGTGFEGANIVAIYKVDYTYKPGQIGHGEEPTIRVGGYVQRDPNNPMSVYWEDHAEANPDYIPDIPEESYYTVTLTDVKYLEDYK